jgi:hypothetical protein
VWCGKMIPLAVCGVWCGGKELGRKEICKFRVWQLACGMAGQG